MLKRAGGRCERCGHREDGVIFSTWIVAHHRLPRARGGKHVLENGAGLCVTCHGRVHDHTATNWRDFIVTRK